MPSLIDTEADKDASGRPKRTRGDWEAATTAAEVQVATQPTAKRLRSASSSPCLLDAEDENVRTHSSDQQPRRDLVNDYVELASNLVLNYQPLGPYGYNPSKRSYPLESQSTLTYLKNPLRQPTILEQWSPYEIAVFEGALALHGKEFYKIHLELDKKKTTQQVIDFYYIWKKTSHYQAWKKTFVPDFLDHSDDEDDKAKNSTSKK